jgi:hypothetical protein
MNTRTIALSAMFVLSTPMALAQTAGSDAVVVAPDRSGAPVAGPGPGGPATGTTDEHGRNEPLTSGMSRSTPGAYPGARDRSRTGGEGVNDRPPGN